MCVNIGGWSAALRARIKATADLINTGQGRQQSAIELICTFGSGQFYGDVGPMVMSSTRSWRVRANQAPSRTASMAGAGEAKQRPIDAVGEGLCATRVAHGMGTEGSATQRIADFQDH
jgi:hypothetical protein